MNRFIALFSILLLLGCDKPEDRSCLKSIGDQSTKEISLDEFNKLHLGPHLRYVLVQDTINKVVLSGGANLLNFVTTEITDNMLTVENVNDCNFLRSYDEIIVAEIHLKNIINIHFEGTHELTCQNTINTSYMTITIRDGAGEVNFDLNAVELRTVVAHGWGNFKLSGNVGYLNLDIRSNGFGRSYDLSVTDSVDVISKTAENVHVNVDGCQFRAQTLSSGDIYFKGIPASTEFYQYGSGELIDNN